MQPDIIPIICHRCQWHWWQICHQCRWYWWQFATGVVDTGGKFATGIVDTGGKFATGVNNTRGTGGKICAGVVDTGGKFAAIVVDTGGNLPPVSLTPMVHLDLRISPRIFEKIRNDPNFISRGLGEGDSWKKPEAKISWHGPFKLSNKFQFLEYENKCRLFMRDFLHSWIFFCCLRKKLRARICKYFKKPRNRFQGIDSASLCSLAGRYVK